MDRRDFIKLTAITGTSATLADLYLLPGDHTLRVRGRDGAYELRLTAGGGPDPDAEREPSLDDVFLSLTGHRAEGESPDDANPAGEDAGEMARGAA